MRVMVSTSQLTPELLAAIGSIAAESAYLERFMETVLYSLTKLDRDIGKPMIERGMFDAKAQLLREVGAFKLKRRAKQCEAFLTIMSAIMSSNSDRGTAIHGIWLRRPKFGGGWLDFGWEEPTAHKRGRPGKPDIAMTAQRAMDVAREISEAHHDLHEFVYRTWPRQFPRHTLQSLTRPTPAKGRSAKHTSARRPDGQ